MGRHLPLEVNRKRKRCPLDGIAHEVQLEVVQVEGMRAYEIPRLCLEFLGIDVGPLNSTYWFRSEDSARARAHEHAHFAKDLA